MILKWLEGINMDFIKELNWRRLDNSAKIFPISESKKYSTVFRISALLKEDIDKTLLEEAINMALKVFSFFKVRIKSGFFWYYFEENTKKVKVEEEKNYPCKYISPRTNNNYLFKVTYYKNKINIDIFHALTDGNSGTEFFKEIIYNYIDLKYPKNFKKNTRELLNKKYSTEDSYIKNYTKSFKSAYKPKKAYALKGKNISLGAVSVIHEIVNLEQLQNVCKKRNATITQFLTAILIYAIYAENFKKYNGKKPIKVCIPVNLKKYFISETVSNFFSYITVIADITNDKLNDFDTILDVVKSEFKSKLNEEEITKTMSANVRLGTNIATRLVPLFLKKIFVKLSYIEIRKYGTITFSNIGKLSVLENYKDYIKYFMILIAPDSVEKIKCSSCTFNNSIVFTFTSILNDVSIQKRFYEFLIDQGINVEIESNGVLDDISRKD